MSTPARERSGFGQFQMGQSHIRSDLTKVRKQASATDMAAWIRGGVTLHDTARAFGIADSTLRSRFTDAGYSSSGQPLDTFPEPEVKAPHPSFAFVDQPWATEALCAQTDPESFFPDKGGSAREAKKVCAQCFVQAECLDWALSTNERFGIWGGLSERERRKVQHPKPAPARTVPCTTPGCPDLFATEGGRKRHASYVHTNTERTAS